VKYELGFHIPEDDILHSYCREILKSYIALTGWTLAETSCVSCEVRTGFLYPRIRHSSYSREHVKSYIALTGWTV
jgi:hypothetical protein